MQFLVIGLDGRDSKAMDRRLAARKDHIALGDKLLASGNMWYGAALLDDNGKMKGSVLIREGIAKMAEKRALCDRKGMEIRNYSQVQCPRSLAI